MKFHILTIFPEQIEAVISSSILKRAIENNVISVNIVDIREHSADKHKKTDDYVFGGGAGMLMTPQPIYDAYKSLGTSGEAKVIMTSPAGKVFNQSYAKELSSEEEIIIICGHYEGVDQRVIDLLAAEEVSIGDYVLTGGELPACIILDAVSRLVKGVLNKEESHEEESFENNLLEYPQYTRPQEFMGLKVPDVLVSGNHAEIKKWREEKSLEKTIKNRPDLLKGANSGE